MKKAVSIFLSVLLVISLLSGCNRITGLDNTGDADASSVGGTSSVDMSFSATNDDMFTDRDQKGEYDENGAVIIELKGNTAVASSDKVAISGSTVTVTENKTHIISGTLNDGMIIVNAEETAKLQLVFKGVSITSSTSAALYILSGDKVFLTLDKNSVNSLTNGGEFTAIDENNIDGALFSKQDLTINGEGTLTVTSPASHGIVCKDDLVITGGNITVNSASHGIDANDSIRVTNATVTVDSGKDGLHAENTDDASLGFIYINNTDLNLDAEGDGISASAHLQIDCGNITATAGGGSENGSKEHSDSFGGFMGGGRPGHTRPGEIEAPTTSTTDDSGTSMKGIKAESGILISGGEFNINSADDSVHSNSSLVIEGGVFNIRSGDDAIHAEDTLKITGGDIEILESYEGLEGLHIDVAGGNIKLNASDDGLNAAGGTDQSGTEGGRDGMFGGGKGGMGGGMSANSDGTIKISGGILYINSSGDGIDANGMVEITGGHTTVVGPTQGDTSTLDFDISAIISGGTFIGTGASGMAQTFSDSSQGVIAVNAGNQAAGTRIILEDASGNTLFDYTPELDFSVIILSSPDLVKGEGYTLTVGNQSKEFEAN